MMKVSYTALAALAVMAPAVADAAVTFNGVCAATATATQAACTNTSGTYGNSVTIQATTDATLKLKVSAWQANQATNKITSAFLGDYAGGFGVTGVQDVDSNNLAGGNGSHQIDNVNGYTDFVLLQFSRAVHLEGLNLNVYLPYTDSDASIWNGSALTPSTWNAAIDLSQYAQDATLWSNTAGDATSGYRAVSYGNSAQGANANQGFSQVWLVGASVLATDRNDGFKLAQIVVTPQIPAVPEPATWGMMIAGFGAIGMTLRRRRAAGLTVSA